MLFAEFPQYPLVRRMNELGSLRRTSLLERVGNREQRIVQVCQLDFDVRVGDGAKLVQLGAPARHSPELRLFQDGLKRILVPIASVDRFDMLVHTGNDEVREIHGSSWKGELVSPLSTA